MNLRTITSILLSALLVAGLVPASALAEATDELAKVVETQGQQAMARVEYCLGDEDEPEWISFGSLREAEEIGDEVQGVGAMRPQRLRVRLCDVGLAGGVEVRTQIAGGEWSEEWLATDDSASAPQGVALESNVQMRLVGDVASEHDVWYRVRTEDGTWQNWAHDGASAAANCQDAIADVQLVLLSKEESALEDAAQANDAEGNEPSAETDPELEAGPAETAEPVQLGEPEQTEEEQTEQQDLVSVDAGSGDAEPAVAASPELGTTEPEPQIEVQSNDSAKALVVAESAPAAAKVRKQSAITVVEESAVPALSVQYRVHAQSHGWMKWTKDGKVAGTSGESKRLEAIRIKLPAGTDGGITYQVHAQSYGWMNWTKNGRTAGTSGESKRLEAIRIKLTGNVAKSYDVWYRVHAQGYGWMSWVRNGKAAGTSGESKRLEAIQITLVPKGGSKPQGEPEVVGADPTARASVSYHANSSNFGWGGWVSDGSTSGAVGVSNMVQGFSAQLLGQKNSNLRYRAYMQGSGWQSEVSGGSVAGQPGKGKRLEAMRMRLVGTAAKNYDIYYRVYLQDFGWLAWAKNNAVAGSTGLAKRIEAMQVVLVKKGDPAPAGSGRAVARITKPALQYAANVQSYGWMAWVKNGKSAGTSGESKRLEALKAQVSQSGLTGEVQINAHSQSYGWLGYVGQGQVAGVVGQSKRMEALRVRLTGELARYYDVWYRLHVQKLGWMGWASNGADSGTSALSLRVEAVQIKLVRKGAAAPGSTAQAFVDGSKVTKLGYQNPSGYYQVSSKNVSITPLARAPWNYVTPSRIGIWATRTDCVNAFVQRAREYVGSPYVWNYSCAPGVGVDCVGLVYQCAYACGMDLGGGTAYDDFNPWAHYSTGNSGWHSHDANNFWNYGKALHVPLSARRKGDVIWWTGHVAIYIGNDQIIEAYTPATGVIYSGLYDHGAPEGCIRLFQ